MVNLHIVFTSHWVNGGLKMSVKSSQYPKKKIFRKPGELLLKTTLKVWLLGRKT